MSNVASANPDKTGDVPSAGGSSTHQLSNNTVIVVAGASGDLAKKKVSRSSSMFEIPRSARSSSGSGTVPSGGI